MDVTKSVQGVALYAEFSRSGATTQVIVTPRGYDLDGREVGAYIIRRTVSTDNPRKQWRFSGLASGTPIMQIAAEKGVSLDEAKEISCDETMRYASSLFDQIVRGDWLLAGDPLLVEVSKIDLDAIRQSKTPTKLLYRITQSRLAKGYPAEIVNTTATV